MIEMIILTGIVKEKYEKCCTFNVSNRMNKEV